MSYNVKDWKKILTNMTCRPLSEDIYEILIKILPSHLNKSSHIIMDDIIFDKRRNR